MASAVPENTPEAARDGLLHHLSEMQRLDSAGTFGLVLSEINAESRGGLVTWDTIAASIRGRQYTLYGALHQDVQSAISLIGIPDKKRSKLQKTCAKVMKETKRYWSSVEVQVRTQLYNWHPEGAARANQVRCRAPSALAPPGPSGGTRTPRCEPIGTPSFEYPRSAC